MSDYSWPFKSDKAYITSPYGPRDGGFHNGIDFTVPSEEAPEIYAIHKGTCVISEMNATAGGWIVVQEDSTHFDQYMHLQEGSLKPKVGDTIKAGDDLGKMGTTGNSTGNHLHLGITKILDAQSVEGTGYNPGDFLQIANKIGNVTRPAGINPGGTDSGGGGDGGGGGDDSKVNLIFMNIIPRWF